MPGAVTAVADPPAERARLANTPNPDQRRLREMPHRLHRGGGGAPNLSAAPSPALVEHDGRSTPPGDSDQSASSKPVSVSSSVAGTAGEQSADYGCLKS